MNTLARQLSRLRKFNAWVQGGDPKLAEEARDLKSDMQLKSLEVAAAPEALENQLMLESISLRRTRPVLAIKQNVTELAFAEPEDSEIWKQRLERASKVLK